MCGGSIKIWLFLLPIRSIASNIANIINSHKITNMNRHSNNICNIRKIKYALLACYLG